MARWPLLGELNGATFDPPTLGHYFGRRFPTPALHLDLCHVCRRLGWRAGSRSRGRAGLRPALAPAGVDGLDAIFLWRYWKAHQDVAALRLLAEYNLYDSIQLRTRGPRYNRGIEKLGLADEPALPVWERGDVLYDVTRYLLTLGPEGNVETALDRARQWALGGATGLG
jgi:hypothetical protein